MRQLALNHESSAKHKSTTNESSSFPVLLLYYFVVSKLVVKLLELEGTCPEQVISWADLTISGMLCCSFKSYFPNWVSDYVQGSKLQHLYSSAISSVQSLRCVRLFVTSMVIFHMTLYKTFYLLCLSFPICNRRVIIVPLQRRFLKNEWDDSCKTL